MEKNFLIGRSNFALTVFVPSDCPRDCEFCTSKQMYKEHGPFDRESALVSALTYLEKANRNNRIQDIVFTGGDPMMDIESLRLMISMVPNKNVYINTLLINKQVLTFINMVNDMPQIKGVNISRHKPYAPLVLDFSPTANAPDNIMEEFQKPVRINVVVLEHGKNHKDFNKNIVLKVLERWAEYDNVQVNFRADYRQTTPETLHSFQDEFFKAMSQTYPVMRRTYCDVCDTTVFGYELDACGLPRGGTEKTFTYHRGLERSSVETGQTIIVNDAILIPEHTEDGKTRYVLRYDWGKDARSEEFEHWFFDDNSETQGVRINMEPNNLPTPVYVPSYVPSNGCWHMGCNVGRYYQPSCGSGVCGCHVFYNGGSCSGVIC